MDIQIVYDQVNGAGQRIAAGDLGDHLGKLGTRAVRRGKGEVPPGMRFHRTKHIGSASPLVLTIALSDDARSDRFRRSHVAM